MAANILATYTLRESDCVAPCSALTHDDASSSPRSHERLTALFLENRQRYLAGEPLLNVVNKTDGY